ncbi:MAG: hypothetical protein ACC662_11535 [Planctomycetota bacterium]
MRVVGMAAGLVVWALVGGSLARPEEPAAAALYHALGDLSEPAFTHRFC